MKPSTLLFGFVMVIVGTGIIFYLIKYAVTSHAVPTLTEFLASTTENEGKSTFFATSTEDSLLSASSTTAYTVSSTTVQNTDNVITPNGVLHAPVGPVRVQIVKTPAERQVGLSGKTFLAEGEGMLFVFPKSDIYPFWMKDMNFSIDIVWIDSSKRVVSVSENISPETYPENFLPAKKIQFVLEVTAGEAKKFGLIPGAVVSF